MASASPTAVDSADAAKKREFIIGPLVVVRLGSRPTKLGFDRTHPNVTLGRKNFVASPLVSAPHPSEQPPITGPRNDGSASPRRKRKRRTGRFNSVRQISHDAVPPVGVNPATISAAT